MRNTKRRDEPETRQPVKKIKMWVGSNVIIDVAIWENEYRNGRESYTVYNTTIQKSYKDDKGDWHRPENPSFSLTELAVLMFMLQQAGSWINEQREKDN